MPEMPEMNESTDAPAVRLRALRFRAWHRGFRELDLILGQFADRYAASLGEVELSAFEALLEANDTDVYHWIIGQSPVPSAHDTALMTRLQRLDYLKQPS